MYTGPRVRIVLENLKETDFILRICSLRISYWIRDRAWSFTFFPHISGLAQKTKSISKYLSIYLKTWSSVFRHICNISKVAAESGNQITLILRSLCLPRWLRDTAWSYTTTKKKTLTINIIHGTNAILDTVQSVHLQCSLFPIIFLENKFWNSKLVWIFR